MYFFFLFLFLFHSSFFPLFLASGFHLWTSYYFIYYKNTQELAAVYARWPRWCCSYSAEAPNILEVGIAEGARIQWNMLREATALPRSSSCQTSLKDGQLTVMKISRVMAWASGKFLTQQCKVKHLNGTMVLGAIWPCQWARWWPGSTLRPSPSTPRPGLLWNLHILLLLFKGHNIWL